MADQARPYPPLPRADACDGVSGTVGWSERALRAYVDADRAALAAQPAPAPIEQPAPMAPAWRTPGGIPRYKPRDQPAGEYPAPVEQPAPEERTRYLIERKSVLPSWDVVGPSHSTLEQALKALPYYRQDTKKDLRIVREKRLTVHIDSVQGVGNGK